MLCNVGNSDLCLSPNMQSVVAAPEFMYREPRLVDILIRKCVSVCCDLFQRISIVSRCWHKSYSGDLNKD